MDFYIQFRLIFQGIRDVFRVRSLSYIYSIYCAREYLRDDDILLLHGDLVCEDGLLEDILVSSRSCVVTYPRTPLSAKDFKAVLHMGAGGEKQVAAIGVDYNGTMN